LINYLQKQEKEKQQKKEKKRKEKKERKKDKVHEEIKNVFYLNEWYFT